MTLSRARTLGALQVMWGFSLGAVALVAGAANAQVRPQVRPEGLNVLFRQFQSLSSLHFLARGDIIMWPCELCGLEPRVERHGGDDVQKFQDVIKIKGSIEYQYSAEGDRYFIDSWAEPDELRHLRTEVAYDGQRFQLLLSDGTLSVSSVDSSVILPLLPNPLLELVRFRYPVTDENSDTELRLKDVQRDQVPPEFWAIEWAPVEECGRKLERAIFPGGTYEGLEYVHHVFVPEGARNMPVRIDRVGPHGRMTSTEFSDYRRIDTMNSPTYWPHKIVMRAFDKQGDTPVFISFVLTDLAVDVDIPDEVFTIPPDRALRVWDDDQRRFLETAEH